MTKNFCYGPCRNTVHREVAGTGAPEVMPSKVINFGLFKCLNEGALRSIDFSGLNFEGKRRSVSILLMDEYSLKQSNPSPCRGTVLVLPFFVSSKVIKPLFKFMSPHFKSQISFLLLGT